MNQMTKLLLVDDETTIRRGLSRAIPWDSYGVQVVGEADNGSAALKLIEEYQPDIVITDIRMPVMDGLELSHCIAKRGFGCKVILISGYNDFEYARQALRCGVREYLLKPVKMEEVVELVQKIQGELTEQSIQQQTARSHEILLNDNFDVIRKHFFQDLVTGKRQGNTTDTEYAQGLGISFLSAYCQTILLRIDKCGPAHGYSDNDCELVRYAVMNIAEELLLEELSPVFICDWETDSVLAVIGTHAASGDKNLLKQCESIRFSIFKYFPYTITVVIGNAYSGLGGVRHSYHDIQYMLHKEGSIFKNQVILAERSAKMLGGQELSDKKLNREMAALRLLDKDIRPEHRWIVLEAIDFVEKHYRENIRIADIASKLYISPNYFSRIFKNECGVAFSEWLNEYRIGKAKQLLRSAGYKILEVATQCGYSDYKYFNYVFNRMAGMSPTDYIRQHRETV